MAIKRLVEQWSSLESYFNAEAAAVNAPKNVLCIQAAFNNKEFKLYILFLSYVLDIIAKMNLEFQSDKTRIHLLYKRMSDLYSVMLNNYLEKEYVASNRDTIHLVNPAHTSKYLPLDDIYVGAAADILIKSGEVSSSQIGNLKLRVLDYYKTLCVEIRKKFDFSSAVYKNLSLIDPNEFMDSKTMKIIVPLAQQFPNLANANDLITIDNQYRALQSSNVGKSNLNDIDAFWINVLNEKDVMGNPIYHHLALFVSRIMSLPHANAEVERVFSKLALIKTKLRNRLLSKTVERLLLSKDLLKSHGSDCFSFSYKKIDNTDILQSDNDNDSELITDDADTIDNIIEFI